ncbi:hypothetical protein CONCODRAFT_3557 [Conidiobolus coronatus NRRL 28638]|uniref:HTH La-type RNA-binding domain-containing protein n=1 Tax=Conidiobolus coronatus (strain ATCC 28846 / CBS 209.66 / NRRL 28638) TaxID=796925 RepID=A0A137PEM4_CONC2|nr:hypothetical protein CONCODRAFT_3557 [Conidiobolus coronatus NRRL 28638]|eukprot:KXN73456.1 hypothetical protein CONCODRAFT_3557 [Conidiobolus coronatus NRRL 28638]
MSISNNSTQINDVQNSTSKSNTTQQNEIDTHNQELKNSLKSLIDFYFSKDNLRTDDYLVSKMDNEMFVPIQAVLELEKVKDLTSDYLFVISTLKETNSVILDSTETKVKPNITLIRNTLLLRELPNGVTEQEIRNLFDESCPPLVSIRLDIGNNWFLVYKTEVDATKTYSYLREKTIRGQDISIRIKSESILRGAYNPQTVNTNSYAYSNQPLYGPIPPISYHPVIPPYPYQFYPTSYPARPDIQPEPYYFPQIYPDAQYRNYSQDNRYKNQGQNRPPRQYRQSQQHNQSNTSNSNHRNHYNNHYESSNSYSGTYERRQRDDRNYYRNDSSSSGFNKPNFGSYRPNNQHSQKKERSVNPKPEPEITQESFPPLSASSDTTSSKARSSHFPIPMSQVVKNNKQSQSQPAPSSRDYNATSNNNGIHHLSQKYQSDYPKSSTKDDDLNQLNDKLEQITISPAAATGSYASILKQKVLEQAKIQSHSGQSMKQTKSK